MKNWYKVKNNTDTTDIYIFGNIVSDIDRDVLIEWLTGEKTLDTYPLDIQNVLKEAGTNQVNIHINSGGGDLFAGIAIANMLKQYKGQTVAYVDGLAASAAALVAFGCNRIVVPENAFLMIHRAIVTTQGNYDDLEEIKQTLEKFDNSITQHFLAKAKDGITEDKIFEMLKNETWLSGREAQNYFNIEVVEPLKIANYITNRSYVDDKKLKELELELEI